MFIEVELSGNGKSSEFLCNSGCPCLASNEYGYDCGMGYHLGNMQYHFNGWVNYDTGEILKTKKMRRGQYIHPGDGWHKTIVRPQECIDNHGM